MSKDEWNQTFQPSHSNSWILLFYLCIHVPYVCFLLLLLATLAHLLLSPGKKPFCCFLPRANKTTDIAQAPPSGYMWKHSLPPSPPPQISWTWLKRPWLGPVLCSEAQSCLTLCDPIDYSPPGSSVHGILPARILKWVAISSSRGSSQPRDRTHISCIGRRVLYH